MTVIRKKKKQQNRSRVAALALIGAGLLLLGVVALVALPKPGATAESAGERSAIPMEVSFPAPELSLTDLEGNPVSLQDLRGTVVRVNNWATWCPPCKAEMPTLQAYFEDHRKKGFTIIAIDAGDPVPEAIAAFRNQGLPSSYVIDRNGTVRLAWAGAVSRDVLEKYVTPLLKEE